MATRNNQTPERAASAASDPRLQAELLTRAMEAFHQRDFQRALPLFEAASQGPVRDMAHSARTHLRMCESRMAKDQPPARSAEENYHHGMAQLNLRAFADAATLLELSLTQRETDEAHYALAATLGHQGELDRAAHHLQRAIEMQPRNRAMAATDPDFLELAKFQPIRDLLTGS